MRETSYVDRNVVYIVFRNEVENSRNKCQVCYRQQLIRGRSKDHHWSKIRKFEIYLIVKVSMI